MSYWKNEKDRLKEEILKKLKSRPEVELDKFVNEIYWDSDFPFKKIKIVDYLNYLKDSMIISIVDGKIYNYIVDDFDPQKIMEEYSKKIEQEKKRLELKVKAEKEFDDVMKKEIIKDEVKENDE